MPKTTQPIDWDTQPLGKMSDRALAERLGVDPSSVWGARKARDIPPFEARAAPVKRKWGRLNWSKSNGELARQLGCSESTVARHRKRLGKDTYEGGHAPKGIDWSQVDWSLSDSALAKKLGCTYQRVWTARKRHQPQKKKVSRSSKTPKRKTAPARPQRRASKKR